MASRLRKQLRIGSGPSDRASLRGKQHLSPKVVWPLLRTYNQNAAFKKCSKPEALENLAIDWITGMPFHAILKNLTDQGAQLTWGKSFRALTIDNAVDMCENGLAFDASLLLGAIIEIVVSLAPHGVEDLTARLQSLQKMLKYGCSTPGAIVLYELGFADRPLVTELSAALNVAFDEQRRDVIRRLQQKSPEVDAIFDRYPAYFSYIASRIA